MGLIARCGNVGTRTNGKGNGIKIKWDLVGSGIYGRVKSGLIGGKVENGIYKV